MSGRNLLLDAYRSGGGLDGVATALVDFAFASDVDTRRRGPLAAHGTPQPSDEPQSPDHAADPLQPRRSPGPGEALPVDAPPVPKLQPLE